MATPQFIYQIIYQKQLNRILRAVNRLFSPILPNSIKLPPSGTITLKTDAGILKMATNQTSYLTQLLYWNGYKSFEYSAIFESLAKKVDTFLDIGSNIGYYSLLAAKANTHLKAYAFEPALGPKYFLNQNIVLNGLQQQITAVDIALSNQTGAIDFYEVENVKYRYLTYNLAGEGNAGTKKTSRNFIKNTVHATTLEKYMASSDMAQIDLIKIDTEGTEFDILLSGRDVIKAHQPIVICETLFNTIEGALEGFFSELEYSFYQHTKQGLKKAVSIQRATDDGIRNCFFVPKSKEPLIAEFVV